MTKLNVDMDALAKMAALLNDSGLTEIEWEEGDVKVRLCKAPAPVIASAQPAAAPAVPVAQPAGGGEAPAAEPEARGTKVLSPMVGTVYLSPEPGARPFVQVGDTVDKGQTVMIVEAMKTMNPVPAPVAGKVVAVMVDNEEPVEFEQPLVVIE